MFQLPTPIPEAWSFNVEVGILVFVILGVFIECIALWFAWMSYKIATRKRGRPKKNKVEKLMIRLSKQLRETIAISKEDD